MTEERKRCFLKRFQSMFNSGIYFFIRMHGNDDDDYHHNHRTNNWNIFLRKSQSFQNQFANSFFELIHFKLFGYNFFFSFRLFAKSLIFSSATFKNYSLLSCSRILLTSAAQFLLYQSWFRCVVQHYKVSLLLTVFSWKIQKAGFLIWFFF